MEIAPGVVEFEVAGPPPDACLAVGVGCAAGQLSQTSREFSAVDGTFGNVGNGIVLRNVLIPYPSNPTGSYPIGSLVPGSLNIINQGTSVS